MMTELNIHKVTHIEYKTVKFDTSINCPAFTIERIIATDRDGVEVEINLYVEDDVVITR